MSKPCNHLGLVVRALKQVMLDHVCGLRAAQKLRPMRWLYPAQVALA
jgi:hypothetical protein